MKTFIGLTLDALSLLILISHSSSALAADGYVFVDSLPVGGSGFEGAVTPDWNGRCQKANGESQNNQNVVVISSLQASSDAANPDMVSLQFELAEGRCFNGQFFPNKMFGILPNIQAIDWQPCRGWGDQNCYNPPISATINPQQEANLSDALVKIQFLKSKIFFAPQLDHGVRDFRMQFEISATGGQETTSREDLVTSWNISFSKDSSSGKVKVSYSASKP